jgi:hypothetical protein
MACAAGVTGERRFSILLLALLPFCRLAHGSRRAAYLVSGARASSDRLVSATRDLLPRRAEGMSVAVAGMVLGLAGRCLTRLCARALWRSGERPGTLRRCVDLTLVALLCARGRGAAGGGNDP